MGRRIGLYIEHGVGGGVGGAELLLACLASAWSRSHEVDLLHHRPSLTTERLSAFTADDLSRVTVKPVPKEPYPPETRNLFRRYREAVNWHRAISRDYDVFVNCTHWLPCFSHAKRGILLVLFPIYTRPEQSESIRTLPGYKRLRHAAYFGAEWSRRIATYQSRIAISAFARDWTAKRWGVDCAVVHPPVDVDAPPARKEPLILSVGRYVTRGHHKKQLEMVSAFRDMDHSNGWRYVCVGGLNDKPENQEYFARVKATADGCPLVSVEANLNPDQLRSLYSRGQIFWHATGFDDDTDSRPELAEHFGMTTVEAMAAGCVPVVVNKGGQSEIVEHRRSGFLWNTLDELKHFTRVLMEDHGLRQRMSSAARERAQLFSRSRFVCEMSRHAGIPV